MQYKNNFLCVVAVLLLGYNNAAPTSSDEVLINIQLPSAVTKHKTVKKDLKIPDKLKKLTLKTPLSQQDNSHLSYLRAPRQKIKNQGSLGKIDNKNDVLYNKSNKAAGSNLESQVVKPEKELNYLKQSDETKKLHIKRPRRIVRNKKLSMPDALTPKLTIVQGRPESSVKNFNTNSPDALMPKLTKNPMMQHITSIGNSNLKAPDALKKLNHPKALRPAVTMKDIESAIKPKEGMTGNEEKSIEYTKANNENPINSKKETPTPIEYEQGKKKLVGPKQDETIKPTKPIKENPTNAEKETIETEGAVNPTESKKPPEETVNHTESKKDAIKTDKVIKPTKSKNKTKETVKSTGSEKETIKSGKPNITKPEGYHPPNTDADSKVEYTSFKL